MRSFLALSLGLVCLAGPASAIDVTLSATLVNSCVLTLNSSGTMTTSTSGTILSSEQSGGSAASLGVVAVGRLPTVSFAAPALTTSPAGWTGSPTTEVRYTSGGGANQSYTTDSSSYSPTGLTDSITVHGRVTSSSGFAAGNYTLRTVVTCS